VCARFSTCVTAATIGALAGGCGPFGDLRDGRQGSSYLVIASERAVEPGFLDRKPFSALARTAEGVPCHLQRTISRGGGRLQVATSRWIRTTWKLQYKEQAPRLRPRKGPKSSCWLSVLSGPRATILPFFCFGVRQSTCQNFFEPSSSGRGFYRFDAAAGDGRCRG
jgi:hypothetical protein